MAKRSGKPGRKADGHAGTAADQRNDAGQRSMGARGPAIREPPSRPPALHPGASSSPGLARAQAAMRSGDFRTARSLASDVATRGDENKGDEKEREQARRILENLKTDRAALIAAACVFLVIAVAAILALFRAH